MAKCAQCGVDGASPRDGFCGGCRLRAFGQARRRYVWTEALIEELRGAYRLRKLPRARAIDVMAKRTGWPRKVFTQAAVRMGITTWRRKVWAAEEDALLREWVGTVGWATIARRLRRSKGSVQARSDYLGMSRRPVDGYTALMLQKFFGVNYSLIRRWIDRGLFGAVRDGRVSEAQVLRFVRRYPQDYDLRRVDQTAYKALLFGAGGRAA
jgi:hypothetical protein